MRRATRENEREIERTALQDGHLADLEEESDALAAPLGTPLWVRRTPGAELEEVVEPMRTHVYVMSARRTTARICRRFAAPGICSVQG